MRKFHEIITIITIQLLTRKHIVTSRDFKARVVSLVAFDRAVFFVKDRLPKQLGTSFDRMIKPAAPRGHRVMGIDAGQGIECTQSLKYSQSLGSRKVQTCGPATDGRYTSLQGVPKGIPLRAKRDQLC